MTPQANSPPAPETSSGSELRKSSRIAAMKQIPAKKQKPDDPLNVCSSVYSVIMIAHDNFEGHAVYRFDAATIVTSRRCKRENRFSKGKGEGEGCTRWRR